MLLAKGSLYFFRRQREVPLPQWAKKPLGIQTGHSVPQVEHKQPRYCHRRDRNEEVTDGVGGHLRGIGIGWLGIYLPSQLFKGKHCWFIAVLLGVPKYSQPLPSIYSFILCTPM